MVMTRKFRLSFYSIKCLTILTESSSFWLAWDCASWISLASWIILCKMVHGFACVINSCCKMSWTFEEPAFVHDNRKFYRTCTFKNLFFYKWHPSSNITSLNFKLLKYLQQFFGGGTFFRVLYQTPRNEVYEFGWPFVGISKGRRWFCWYHEDGLKEEEDMLHLNPMKYTTSRNDNTRGSKANHINTRL